MSDLIPLTGEPLALDLVNTRPYDADLLGSPAELRTWLELEADRLPDPAAHETAGLTVADVAAVHAVRDGAGLAIGHARRGERPPASALEALNDAQRAAPAIRELAWDGSSIIAARRRSGTAGVRLAAWLAEAAADLIADPQVTKVRECEAEDCVLLFLPAHPRRRWCSAARCGNRARVARHYQRHRPA
ncbi:CGNR zinc finger domain-containing protein [Actinoallomurus sp. CA-150999]|uniref:CGNR zinc finger domain-containing protein n=1 Tax=Actinoallomurus sp. CA-150999 TaxID=3239887 RepID=UPI003D8C13E5